MIHNIADRIRYLRDKAGMTQTDLAKASGVSRFTIIALESGAQKVTTTVTLAKIASALGVGIEDIFFAKSV